MAAPFQRPVHTRFNAADHAIRMTYQHLNEFSLELNEAKDDNAKEYFREFVRPSASESSRETRLALSNEGDLPKKMEEVMDNIDRTNYAMGLALYKVEAILENRVPPERSVNIRTEVDNAIRYAKILVDMWDMAYDYAVGEQQNGGVRKRTLRKRTLRKTLRALRKRMHKTLRMRTHRSRK